MHFVELHFLLFFSNKTGELFNFIYIKHVFLYILVKEIQ